MAADNKLLGQFDLVGIPPASRGVPQIEVTFDIDANGIVNVSAVDKATAKVQSIRIQASGGLTEADIDRMVKEAESHASEDKQRRELIEAKNQGEALIHTVEKSLGELGEKVSEQDKTAIETRVTELRTALEGEDRDAIVSKIEALARASMKLGEAAYGQGDGAQSSQGASEESGGGGEGSDGVVDAEFEEVRDDDNKKKSA
jgi:molecular chaperone DnaK